MRYAVLITFLILGIVVGIILPFFLQDRIADAGITLPSLPGSSSSANTHEISHQAIFWFLRGVGVCFALVAVWYFNLPRHE